MVVGGGVGWLLNVGSCQWFAIQSMSNMLATRLNTKVDQSEVKGQVPDIQRYGIIRKYNVWHFYQNVEIKQKHFGNVDGVDLSVSHTALVQQYVIWIINIFNIQHI